MKYMLATRSSMTHLPDWYGHITSPRRGGHRPIHEGRTWCCDNDVFTGKFNPHKFTTTLDTLSQYTNTCAFVAAPDAIGDATTTLEQWPEWADTIHAHGLPAAIVAQDGMTPDQIPGNANAVFIGGSTDWKLSSDAEAIIHAAKTRDLWVHVGRVNSLQRIRRFTLANADSVDGTYHAFAGLPNTTALFNRALSETPLWKGQA